MHIAALQIPDVKLITPAVFADARGTFCETWQRPRLKAAGLDIDFCQDNQSWSRDRFTLRGLHAQAAPFAQAKLVRVIRGAILDVAVDARKGSDTFGHWVSATLSAANRNQLLVPRGFLHGFLTLEPDTEVTYKVDSIYDRDSEIAVHWADPDLAIDWGLGDQRPALSDKDEAAASWASFDSPFAVSAGALAAARGKT